jgi:hypothetical protein
MPLQDGVDDALASHDVIVAQKLDNEFSRDPRRQWEIAELVRRRFNIFQLSFPYSELSLRKRTAKRDSERMFEKLWDESCIVAVLFNDRDLSIRSIHSCPEWISVGYRVEHRSNERRSESASVPRYE